MQLLKIDIVIIRAAGFYWNIKSKETTIFTTIINKIDLILKDKDFQSKYNTENAENKQLIIQNILKKY